MSLTNSRIPLFKVAMSDDLVKPMIEVLHSGYIGQGPQVEKFEEALRRELELPHAPATTNSCTSALDLALHLCDVKPGSKVISTPITCLATNMNIVNRWADILWADVDRITGNIDPISVDDLLDYHYGNVAAVIAVDWAGRPCDYESLHEICAKWSVPIITDAAHSYLAPTGGDFICWSFQAIKHLTCGDGGALYHHNEGMVDRARMLRWYSLDRKSINAMRCKQMVPESGFKYHMNDINATIGLWNMGLARKNIQKCKSNAEYFCRVIQNEKITLPPWSPDSSWWLYTLLVDDQEAFIKHMEKHNIECSLVHVRNDIQRIFSSHKPLPGVDYFSGHEVCIPVGWWVTPEDRNRIASAIMEY